MPFTFAHPAIVLPIARKNNRFINQSAIIIGAMSPDFEYFIHFMPYQKYGHTIMGQFYYNLPLVLLVYLSYHIFLKEIVIINCPNKYFENYNFLLYEEWKISNAKSLLIFSISALVGMFSHIVWDSFTHKNGYFVDKLRVLSSQFHLMGYDIPIYKLLQHGSTLIGFVVILLYLKSANYNNAFPLQVRRSKRQKMNFWMLFLSLSIIVEIIFLIAFEYISIGRIVVSIINASVIVLLLLACIRKVLLHIGKAK